MTFESGQQIKVYKKCPTIAIKYQLNGQTIKKLQISFGSTDEFFQCLKCFNLWNISITEPEKSGDRSSNTTTAQYQNMPSYSQSNGFNSSYNELKSKPHKNAQPNFHEPLQPSSNFRSKNSNDSLDHSLVPSSQLLNNDYNRILPLCTFDSTSSRTTERNFFSTLDTPLLSKSDSYYLNGSSLLRKGSFMYPMRPKNKLSLSNLLNEDSSNQFLNYHLNPLLKSNNVDINLFNNKCLKESTLTSTPDTSFIAIEKDASVFDKVNRVYDVKSVEADLIHEDEEVEKEIDEVMKNLETYVKKRLQDEKFIALVGITKIFVLFAT